jgi:hypothetical protein
VTSVLLSGLLDRIDGRDLTTSMTASSREVCSPFRQKNSRPSNVEDGSNRADFNDQRDQYPWLWDKLVSFATWCCAQQEASDGQCQKNQRQQTEK